MNDVVHFPHVDSMSYTYDPEVSWKSSSIIRNNKTTGISQVMSSSKNEYIVFLFLA